MTLIQRGIQRTGTCLSARLIKEAFGIDLPRNKGRKAPPQPKHLPFREQDVKRGNVLLVNIKDPYAWIASWHAWAVQANYQGTQHPKYKTPVTFSREEIHEQIERWNRLYKEWLSWPYKSLVLRYEDLLKGSNALILPLSALLNQAPRIMPPLPKRTVRAGDIHKPNLPVIPFDMAFYTKKRYLDLLTQDHVSQITDEIDWNLLRGLYQPISTLQGAEHVEGQTA